MKKILSFALVVALVFGAFQLTPKAQACWFCNSDATNQKQNEEQTVANNQAKLQIAVPIPSLENSLERLNISKRLQMWNDPAKVSYIYLTSYGKVMAFYVVKGKVTSGNKRLTAPQNQIGTNVSAPEVLSMEAPELDGTYGSSSPYVFFWTTDGTYVQWSGEYMLSDQPLTLTTTPELVRNVK